jgi:Zn-dependent M28 family amino/carboxypeptidase
MITPRTRSPRHRRARRQGDKIYNGALDNASGCAQVLAIASAFTATRRARSAAMALSWAEKNSLLGSEYTRRTDDS